MKTNKSSGAISPIMIFAILIVIIVVAAGAFFAVRFISKRSQQKKNAEQEEQKTPEPVREVTINNIKFIFDSANDVGNVLSGLTSIRPGVQKDLLSTERFIVVTIKGQNKGQFDTKKGEWKLGNIVDSEGRNYIPSSQVGNWLPKPDFCGTVLKPEFDPIPCVRIYEVSKISTDLKLEVFVGKQKDVLDLFITR